MMKNMNCLKGTQLSEQDRRLVLARFVHRFTGNHHPNWAIKEWKDGKPYPLQFADDNDWLDNTMFAVRTDGSLDNRVKHCFSSPTWPLNPELRK